MTLAILLAAIFLAYANGSNDNFKGVATLFGSGTTDYKKALNWACWTTLAGSLAAVWVAQGLVSKFSGKGLVPDGVAASPVFLARLWAWGLRQPCWWLPSWAYPFQPHTRLPGP